MAIPDPRPGLVINYSYLWRDEARQGREEGVKPRPCMILSVHQDNEGDTIVRVLPITHTSQEPGSGRAIDVPAATGRRLGLDDQRSWMITDESNRFVWPGYDLASRAGRSGGEQFAYGLVPRGLFSQARDQFLERVRDRRMHDIDRDDDRER